MAETAPAMSAKSWDWRSRVASDAPLTGQQRFGVLLRNNFYSSDAALRVASAALADQVTNSPEEWGRSGEGFGRRAGTYFVAYTSRDFIKAGSAALFRRDPRYQRCECKGLFRRTGHAVSALFVSADSTGARRFDPSSLVAGYGAGYIGASFYPDRYRLAVKGYQFGNQQVAQIALENLLLEFGPEVNKVFKGVFRRK